MNPAPQPSDVRLEWLISNTRELPTLPKVTLQVAQLVDRPNTSAGQIAQALARDQALTGRVLKMANSAFYGAPRRIATVTDAIVLLGMRTIRNMTMAVSCQDVLDKEVSSYSIRRGDLWRHSLCVAFAAQQIAKRARYGVTEEAFVAGLLHDIGKVLISTRLAAEFADVMRLSRTGEYTFTAAEREVLGFDHAEVGARLTELWNLPPHLVEAIRYHHTPSLQPEPKTLTLLVHVADVLCIMLGIGLGGDGLQYALEPGVLEKLRLDEDAIETILSSVAEFAGESMAF